MLKQHAGWLLAGTLLLISSVVQAEDGVVQTVAHGQIHWSNGTITATGSGAPSLKAANVAVARLGAERAAKMDARRNILGDFKGARVDWAICCFDDDGLAPGEEPDRGYCSYLKIIDRSTIPMAGST